MMTSPEEQRAVQQATELERPLRAVEDSLAALGTALHRQDAGAVDSAAAQLHSALTQAVDHFARAARSGGVPPPLRHRFALAGGRVAAQREALARATAALDRAIDVLLPPVAGGPAALYGVRGSERPASSGAIVA